MSTREQNGCHWRKSRALTRRQARGLMFLFRDVPPEIGISYLTTAPER